MSFTEGMVDHREHRPLQLSEGRELHVGKSVEGAELHAYKTLLTEYQDVFAWTYTDLKGVPPNLCQHKIELMEGTFPVRQHQYRLNLKYSLMVKG